MTKPTEKQTLYNRLVEERNFVIGKIMLHKDSLKQREEQLEELLIALDALEKKNK